MVDSPQLYSRVLSIAPFTCYTFKNLLTAYTIDEQNAERQQLLAKILNPLTAPLLTGIPKQSIASILDLGCGQGNTTRFLAETFPGASATGFEYDSTLVASASAQAENRNVVSFQQGDAQKLPYPDASFDLVFCPYLLLHLPDPDAAIREMLRVTKPGGYAIAFEPDCFFDMSYPPNPGLATITFLFGKLFAHPNMGRQLVHRFRAAGATKLQAGGVFGIEYDASLYRRIYRITAECLAPAIAAQKLLTPEEYAQLLRQMKELEASAETVVFKFPDVWVMARP